MSHYATTANGRSPGGRSGGVTDGGTPRPVTDPDGSGHDIWLNEGFATYAEWLWSEHDKGRAARAHFDRLYATPADDTDFWNPPPGDPGGPEHMFDRSIYLRGAMALQALRDRVGDGTFFRILRDWSGRHRYGNATTAQFVELAERDAGRDLGRLFDAWLSHPGKPTGW